MSASKVTELVHRTLGLPTNCNFNEHDTEVYEECVFLIRDVEHSKKSWIQRSEEFDRLYQVLAVEQSGRGSTISNLNFIYCLLVLGEELEARNLVTDSFWFETTRFKFARDTAVEEYSPLLSYLLEHGLKLQRSRGSKCLALLTFFMRQFSQCKSKIASFIISNDEVALRIGNVIDNSIDFQQISNLIELIANCFPRNRAPKLPILWANAQKNTSFFSNEEYPSECKRGDSNLINFIYCHCGSRLTTTYKIDNIHYGNDVESTECCFELKPIIDERLGHSYHVIQFIYDKMCIWSGDGLYLELCRKDLDFTQSLKGDINVSFKDCPRKNQTVHSSGSFLRSKRISSIDPRYLTGFGKLKWLKLHFKTNTISSAFFLGITSYRKVSVVQQPLELNHLEIIEDDEVSEDCVNNSHKEDKLEKIETSKDHEEVLVRPKEAIKSVIALKGEEVDLVSPYIEEEPNASKSAEINSEINMKSTTEASIANSRLSASPDQDQHDDDCWDLNATDKKMVEIAAENSISPLVEAQKRKIRRDGNMNLKITKERLQYQEKHSVSDQTKNSNSTSLTPDRNSISEHTKNLKSMGKSTSKKHIAQQANKTKKYAGMRDTNILNTIFGAAPVKKTQEACKTLEKINNNSNSEHQYKKGKINTSATVRTFIKNAKSTTSHKIRNTTGAYTIKSNIGNPHIDFIEDPNDKPISKRLRKFGTHEHEIPESNSKKQKTSEQNPFYSTGIQLATACESATESYTKDNKATNILELHRDSGTPLKDCNNGNSSMDVSDSTTLTTAMSLNIKPSLDLQNTFTKNLQDQIYNSITLFSNELVRKITIINKEINNKIVKELSEKYQRLFAQLQASFKDDTEEMFRFLGDMQTMLNLPEDEMVKMIRNRKFSKAKDFRI